MLRAHTGATMAVVSMLCAGPVDAQSPPPGGHVHYAEPAAQQASPTGALAPRLQNLGPHTFPVSTRNRQAQQFMNQGLNLAYQPVVKVRLHSAGAASRLPALLLPRICPIFSVVAPWQPGAAPASVQRWTFTTGC